ncbi:MAG: peptidyl-prolyl cis-trans isomerase [Methylococcaceae bacterium]|nr:peptidyl-prolyl cis-trans isomerase [Methylococcaceae bacterium]
MRNLLLFLMLFSFTNILFAKENIMSANITKVKMTTSLGDIIIAVDNENAPISAANFLTYVKEGFYNGTIFHRVIPGFMAQAGGFDTDFNEKRSHDQIKNEADNGLKNNRATLAMARTNVPDSASSQFFINYKDNDSLNYTSPTAQGWGYAVFAEVIEGMEVVDAMSEQPTGSNGHHQDVPKTNIVIETAEIVE